ncbi:hypothetical protein BTA51_20925 [Hahella sp. CCB-MM4]|uniref:DUF3426 domain-containing protein n=1 Tax=Hahella sp. (strain CCB-MM4) TaxID=1926491 RepID=UPI000B9BE5ED|nr:DUF3426 domain-containing protein [Hahella sp. CCB-MM4]OZG71403.1 hypothetical protein BTA51_20925 [Hahella sp. CCB-MM4]
MLTRCPHCSASFRVSDAQLQAAHGKVRCGACMKVFNASEHLMSEDTAAAPPPRSQATRPQAKKAAPEPAVAKKDNTSSIVSGDNIFADTDFETPEIDDSLDELTEALTAAGDDIDDELMFQDDPDEDKEEEGYSGGLLDESELSDSFRELEKPDEKKAYEFEGDSEEEEPAGTDESWAEQMLRELEKPSSPSPAPDKPAPPSKAPSKPSSPSASALEVADYSEPTPAPPPRPKTTSSPPPQPDPMASSIRAERDNPYHSLRADPISVRSIAGEGGGSNWYKTAFWTLSIISLLVFLVLQLAWFHFDKLARYDQLRPIYAKACDVLGCTLPSLYDIDKIKSQNLVVRSHPLVNKALIIDAIIINQATFEQPFPDISLNFSDINNAVIAQRRFTPQEYLSGEAKGMKVMPSNVPVHIALEILDPGKEAVNYTLDFIATYETGK